MGPPFVLCAALAAAPVAPRAAAPPPVEIPVTAEGRTWTATVVDKKGHRYRMVPDAKGTVLIAVESIHGPAPNVRLLNAQGKTLRRGVRGKTFARPAPGAALFLDVAPPYKDAASTYHLTVAFDVDRPRALRDRPRAVRPRDIVRVPGAAAADLDQVTVDGLPADYAVNGGDVLVTLPAYAQTGRIELHFDARPPRLHEVELFGVEQVVADRLGECEGAGCISFTIAPSVGPKWLEAIARLLDADVRRHVVRTGSVVVKLRLPSSESYALEQLRRMGNVSSAQRVALSEVTQAPLSP